MSLVGEGFVSNSGRRAQAETSVLESIFNIWRMKKFRLNRLVGQEKTFECKFGLP